MCDVKLRADLESRIDEISFGKLDYNQFREEFKSQVENFYSQIQQIGTSLNLKPTPKKYHSRPTEKQLKYANNLAKRLKIEIPPTVLESATQMSTWIGTASDKANKQSDSTGCMFSEKQRRLVEDNCEDPQVLALLDSRNQEDYRRVSSWIGQFLRSRKNSKSQNDQVIVEFAEDSD